MEKNSYPHRAYILEVVTENKNKERNTQASKHVVPVMISAKKKQRKMIE